MTGDRAAAEPIRASPKGFADVIDADYVVLPRSPDDKLAPDETRRTISPPPLRPEGMEMLRAEEESERGAARRGGPLFWIVGVAMAAAAFWISGGDALVRGAAVMAPSPQAAFKVADLTWRVDASGPHPLLFVDGAAKNSGGASASLPGLQIHVTGNDGSIVHYRLGTSDRALAPGETFAFSSRLDPPKNGIRTVSVTLDQP